MTSFKCAIEQISGSSFRHVCCFFESFLEYNGLAGVIPTENGLLMTLTVFDMEVNAFIKGTFPSELCHLTNLESLSLRGNDMEGNLPSCLGDLRKSRI